MNKSFLTVKPFQETAGMCGPASLKMILEYYGVDKSEEELARLCGTVPDLGTSAQGITTAAQQLGFKVHTKDNSTFEGIQEWLDKKVPVIVDWFSPGVGTNAMADGHYSVVVGLDNEFIYLQDPEINGLRKIKRDAFLIVWFDFKGKYIHPNDLVIRQLIAVYK